MSNAALMWVREIPLRGSKKAVLKSLADAANEHDQCWPSTAKLATWSGCTKRQTIRALGDLERLGVIRIDRKHGANSHYHLNMEWAPPGDMVSPPDGNVTGDILVVTGDILVNVAPPTGDILVATGDMVSPKSIETKERKRIQETKRARGTPHECFEEFWKAYPRKAGKVAAIRAYAKAVKKKPPAELLALLIAYPFDLTRPEYILHASTWLNGERWADEIDTRDPVLVAVGYYDREPPELDLTPMPAGRLLV
jgi:hypothetical protein